MLTLRCLSVHGAAVEGLSFSLLHGFRHLLLYSTSSSSSQSLADYLVHSRCYIYDKLAQNRRRSGVKKECYNGAWIPLFLLGVRALRELLMNDDAFAISKTMKGLRNLSFGGVAEYMLPNVALLLNYGIPMELIRKNLIRRPCTFARKTKSSEEMLIRVEEKFGIPRSSGMLLHGVQVFKSFGWTQPDIVEIIRRNPNCFRLSTGKIWKSLNFLMSELGHKPKYVISNFCLVTCSLESRLVPRYRTLMVLKEKGLVRQNYLFPLLSSLLSQNF